MNRPFRIMGGVYIYNKFPLGWVILDESVPFRIMYIYNKFLLGWVAVQYPVILDESVLYLGESASHLMWSRNQT